jgi:hypothetical protein
MSGSAPSSLKQAHLGGDADLARAGLDLFLPTEPPILSDAFLRTLRFGGGEPRPDRSVDIFFRREPTRRIWRFRK